LLRSRSGASAVLPSPLKFLSVKLFQEIIFITIHSIIRDVPSGSQSVRATAQRFFKIQKVALPKNTQGIAPQERRHDFSDFKKHNMITTLAWNRNANGFFWLRKAVQHVFEANCLNLTLT
jgi:hypothetical protein